MKKSSQHTRSNIVIHSWNIKHNFKRLDSIKAPFDTRKKILNQSQMSTPTKSFCQSNRDLVIRGSPFQECLSVCIKIWVVK